MVLRARRKKKIFVQMLLHKLTSCSRTTLRSCQTFVGRGKPTLGIRRETINAWERRAPLAPAHVKKLTKAGVNVLIQPSNRRAYPIQDYIAAGAVVREDLSDAQLIISVKQVPVDQLIANKAYAFFSHTIKAQPDNMEMLDTILQRKIRLIDYEKIVDEKGKRLVMFGKWAGNAGFIDILHGLGLRLLALGHHTPFLHMGLAHNYSDSHMAVNALRDIGYEIALDKMPRSLGPLVFIFTGSGNVSRGAQELFEHLPHEFVDVATLPKVAQKGQLNKVYGCVVGRADHMVSKNGGSFNKTEFEEHPERYISKFATEIAPYATVIINGVYWDARTPRLITIPDAKHLLTPIQKYEVPGCPTLPHRLVAICDISADPGGSIEFMTECTTIDKPFTIYDADFHTTSDSFDSKSGCLVCSIDNMPAQMPLEATEQFGNLLFPYIFDMLNCTTEQPFDRLTCRPEVKGAIITNGGMLTPNYEYISDLRNAKATASYHKSRVMGADEKKVLLLGAGMVSGPFADFYSKQPKVQVTVATESREDGHRLAKSDNITPLVVDVAREHDVLEQLIRDHDQVVSLLPYVFHPMVAKLCIKNKTNMVTSSYVSPELQALDKAAEDAGVTIMNESGLDPGIDHMLAMECFDEIKEHGGKITSFVSFCGGLPAPESSDNPLRYKFSWSPKGVLTALLNPAKYLQDGKIVEIPSGKVVDHLYPIDFMPGFNLIGYGNRDSTKYSEIYGLGSDCKTLIRGTLRYKGFVETVKALDAVGLLSTEPQDVFNSVMGPDLTWKQLMAALLNQKQDIFPDSLRNIAAEKLGGVNSTGMKALQELGLFSDIVADRHGTALDTLAPYLSKILAFKENERDLVVLNHDIGVRLQSGSMERHRISLVAYGDRNGFSAMARTVGYTCAVVSNMVLQGEIQRPGMLRPVTKEVYRPALKRLADFGIVASKTIIPM
ncbi:saccharopine dehydrogenase [Necator americanus]|uniref:Saccharopine dehydrogenase n=1 Tax=Necator americanus TaxID=51031 RepID=W2TL94_NECAM|nr:saccharopine dehydrogenase [Necator americanus]ETN81777.1 saccharopine dehydrogenase [Necator americanus]